MGRAIRPHTKWPHLFCFPNSSGYFLLLLLICLEPPSSTKGSDALTPSLGTAPGLPFSHPGSAPGPPGLSFSGTCLEPLPKASDSMSSWPAWRSGCLGSVLGSTLCMEWGPPDLRGITWSCDGADCPSRNSTQQAREPEMKRGGKRTSHACMCS